jgi:HEAT repeat protein
MTVGTTEDLLDIDPESVTQSDVELDLVRDAVRNETDLVRDRAAEILLSFAEDDPESVLPAVEEIAVGIGSDHINVRHKTLSAAVMLGEDHVDELEPVVEPTVHCLHDKVPRTQAFAAKVLRPIAAERPEWLVPHTDLLLSVAREDLEDLTDQIPDEVLEDPQAAEQFQNAAQEEKKQQFLARAVAANLLYEAVDTDPSAAPDLEKLLDTIEGADGTVTAAMIDTIAAIGQADPIAIEDAVEPLIELLDHPTEEIQARAVKALGFSGDDRAIEPLRDLADHPGAGDDLQALAAETADWIETETQN